MFLSDNKSNGPQFSKVTTLTCILIAVFCLIGTPLLTIFFGLSEMVATTIITAGGALGATAVVWNLKKSQAENTVKIYLSAYKEIIDLKKENDEDVSDTISEVENNILQRMDYSIGSAIDEATSPIERQDLY